MSCDVYLYMCMYLLLWTQAKSQMLDHKHNWSGPGRVPVRVIANADKTIK